ncbi:MAG: DHHA2 domain-containing protein [Thermodesulfobacteriota bacterium]
MSSMQKYLAAAKANKNNAQQVIIGNEAADLDSMASAITYGCLLSEKDADAVVLPVMPIPRADFKLRTEAVYVFQEAGINLEDLVFFDEVDFGKLMAADAGLVLVDHNKLGPTLEKYNSNVSAVLDHHNDEGMYEDAAPRKIRLVGSTTTLVAEEFSRTGVEIEEDTAILLAGTILLDTVNLAPEAGRVTGADIEAAEKLLPLCSLSRQEFFDNIQREKFSVTGLSTGDLLRKDYKQFQFETVRCGISSALLPVSQWQELDNDLLSGFMTYAASCELEVLLSMNAYTNPDFNRDLVIYCRTKEGHDNLLACLQNNSLDLTPIEYPGQQEKGGVFISFHRQGNLGISRKKLQPLLAEFYQ